ncbi:MAG: 3'(2'),5'-bisphosphate nucleotidase CysQ [Gemmobacter sp.]
MPAHDLPLLVAAARAAGDVALRYWKRPVETREKPGGQGPVTEADLAVNAALAAQLRGARPGYGWLSEEDADTGARAGAEATFIVDPIDGTRAFIAGQDAFAVSLAVARGGAVTAGVVFLPARGTLYAASLDGPATRDGVPITASAQAVPEGARLLTSAAALAPAHWDGPVPAVTRHFRPSLAWRLCLVAEGRHDGMLTLADTWEWDVAAGALIAARAGNAVTDRHGCALRFNAPRPQVAGMLAAPPALHAALVSRLRA